MGILKGTLAVRRFLVRGDVPDNRSKLMKGIRAHAFSPVDPAGDEDRSYGWTGLGDAEAVDLEPSDVFADEVVALTLRVDTLRPPASQVKRLIKESLEKLPRKPTAKDKRDAKDMAVRALRKRAFPTTRTIDLVWRLEDKRVLFFATSKAATLLLVDLFGKSFGCELVPLGPGVVAADVHGDELPDSLEPTVELALGFPGMPGRPTAELLEQEDAA